MDVTPYVTTAQRLSQEIAKFKEREERLEKWRERLETQVRSLAAERDTVYAASSQRLAQETARFQKSLQEAQAQRDRLEAQLKELAAQKEGSSSRSAPNWRSFAKPRPGRSRPTRSSPRPAGRLTN